MDIDNNNRSIGEILVSVVGSELAEQLLAAGLVQAYTEEVMEVQKEAIVGEITRALGRGYVHGVRDAVKIVTACVLSEVADGRVPEEAGQRLAAGLSSVMEGHATSVEADL